MTRDEAKQSMMKRVTWREEKFNARLDKVKRFIMSDKSDGEGDRLWLDQFAVGEGLDICCGDFSIIGADGVDTTIGMLGSNYTYIEGDSLICFESGGLDFIVTNYFDVFPSPLKALNEWYRALKFGGTLAFICCNTDKYPDDLGSLINKSRTSAFSKKTIRSYLVRAGFENIVVEENALVLRVKCNKKNA